MSDLFAGFDPEELDLLTMDGFDDCIVGIVERFGQDPIPTMIKDGLEWLLGRDRV